MPMTRIIRTDSASRLGRLPAQTADVVAIREMQAGDIEAVVELVVRCDRAGRRLGTGGLGSYPTGMRARARGLEPRSLALDRFRAEVACEASGAIVGVVATKGSLAGEGPGSGHITSLFVDPRGPRSRPRRRPAARAGGLAARRRV